MSGKGTSKGLEYSRVEKSRVMLNRIEVRARSNKRCLLQLKLSHVTLFYSTSLRSILFAPLRFASLLSQEKEREDAETKRPRSRPAKRPACNSPSVASAGTSARESTPPAWEPEPPSIWPASSSTSVPRFWNWPETPPATTRRAASSPATSRSRSRTTRNSTSCWAMSRSRRGVSFPTSTPSCFPRRASFPRGRLKTSKQPQ